MPTHQELIQAVSRALLFGFLGHEFSGLAHVAPLDVIGAGCHMWVPGHALCPGPPLEESAAGPGWEQDDLCWSLFLFPFPKDSSAHAAESTRQMLSLCCILVGKTTFLSKREIKAQNILGAGC